MRGEWIEHDGKGRPVHAEDIVDFRRRMDEMPDEDWRDREYRAGDLIWRWGGIGRDITHYRLVTEDG